ncbi:hypothetical protein [Pseudomonas serbica]|uniref:hypothetical protein n=1 Tax=Pseudomonas serbica TaxID=2965074 RepID=UPI00237B14E1|nr:hypothetical protein [Pseudomonas serbica]
MGIDLLVIAGFLFILSLLSGMFSAVAFQDANPRQKTSNCADHFGSKVLFGFSVACSCLLGYLAIGAMQQVTACSAWWFLTLLLPGFVGFALLTPFLLRK